MTLQEYDIPGVEMADGIATFGRDRVAYFIDTEGNILSLTQLG